MKTVKQVLTEALGYIDTRGWTKGDYEDDNGCVCSLGAVNLVVNGDAQNYYIEDHAVGRAAVDLLTESIGGNDEVGCSVLEFNDSEVTELEDVRQMFLRAIEKAT